MVDPLEAKRLAAKQMKEIQKRERFKVKDISCAFKISYPLVYKNPCYDRILMTDN